MERNAPSITCYCVPKRRTRKSRYAASERSKAELSRAETRTYEEEGGVNRADTEPRNSKREAEERRRKTTRVPKHRGLRTAHPQPCSLILQNDLENQELLIPLSPASPLIYSAYVFWVQVCVCKYLLTARARFYLFEFLLLPPPPPCGHPSGPCPTFTSSSSCSSFEPPTPGAARRRRPKWEVDRETVLD